jgi:hypothetical protein
MTVMSWIRFNNWKSTMINNFLISMQFECICRLWLCQILRTLMDTESQKKHSRDRNCPTDIQDGNGQDNQLLWWSKEICGKQLLKLHLLPLAWFWSNH